MSLQGNLSGDDSEKDGSVQLQSVTLQHVAGDDAYNTFTAGDDKKKDKIMNKLAAFCNPRKNIAFCSIKNLES